jgi:hypothetical protein
LKIVLYYASAILLAGVNFKTGRDGFIPGARIVGAFEGLLEENLCVSPLSRTTADSENFQMPVPLFGICGLL